MECMECIKCKKEFTEQDIHKECGLCIKCWNKIFNHTKVPAITLEEFYGNLFLKEIKKNEKKCKRIKELEEKIKLKDKFLKKALKDNNELYKLKLEYHNNIIWFAIGKDAKIKEIKYELAFYKKAFELAFFRVQYLTNIIIEKKSVLIDDKVDKDWFLRNAKEQINESNNDKY